jgi:hypothetical protein
MINIDRNISKYISGKSEIFNVNIVGLSVNKITTGFFVRILTPWLHNFV